MIRQALALALFLAATNVVAQDPTPSPSPKAVEAPFTAAATAGAVSTLTGDNGTDVTPTVFLEMDGPLVLGDGAKARLYSRLGINSSPGADVDLTAIQTFRAASFTAGGYWIVGHSNANGQEIVTGIAAEWGFSSRMPGGNLLPAERLVRHYGIGLKVVERKSGASFTILYGRDEAAGERGWGQWLVYGYVPVPKTAQALVLTGDATVSAGGLRTGIRAQRDVFRLGLVTNLGALLEAISK